MALHDPIPANEKLIQLIAAQHEKAETAINAGDLTVIRAVAALTGGGMGKDALNCDADEAEVLVRIAVERRSAFVGARIACVVQYAIFEYADQLAKAELAQQEQSRCESADDQRIERAQD